MKDDHGRQKRRGFPWRGDSRGRLPPPPSREDVTVLYGFHPVVEALRNRRRHFIRLLATENGAHRLLEAIDPLPIAPEIVRPDAIGRLLEADAVHQGLLLEAAPLPAPRLADLAPDALVLALDQITDPHNVGAIVRSAAAFGVTAILTTGRHAPSVTGVLAKAASGGLEHVPFILVTNLGNALEELAARGFRLVGLDSAAPTPIAEAGLARPLVIVLGSEGRGLRQRTRACCGILARLDTPGEVKSLNVSNAAAIALYEATRTDPRSALRDGHPDDARPPEAGLVG